MVVVGAEEIPLALVEDGAAAGLLGDFGASIAVAVVASDDLNGAVVSVAPVSVASASGLVTVLAAFLLGEDFGTGPAVTGVESDVADCFTEGAPFLAFISGITIADSVSCFAAAAATVAVVFRDLEGDFGGGAAAVDVAGVLLAVVVAIEDGVSFSVVVSFSFLARLARFFGLGDSATGVSTGSAASLTGSAA